ncbi:MAG: hypothetical protein KAS32_20040 [Candidatus Peribacteraceae bacterium]|nr:hypothetical protein [Candidatus Peribacteraceae bacterium]
MRENNGYDTSKSDAIKAQIYDWSVLVYNARILALYFESIRRLELKKDNAKT